MSWKLTEPSGDIPSTVAQSKDDLYLANMIIDFDDVVGENTTKRKYNVKLD